MGVILGDQITKIVAENKGVTKKMTIANNIVIKDVKKQEFVLEGERKPVLAIEFSFGSTYGESGSKIELDGKIFYSSDKKELENLEKAWRERKTLQNEAVELAIRNRALEVGLLQAVALANQLHLPAPIQLPRFVPAGKQEAKQKETEETEKSN
ncbi:MAG: hypothetical protein ACP5KK_00310 [Candidatus Nanoarchaeia archaeon]